MILLAVGMSDVGDDAAEVAAADAVDIVVAVDAESKDVVVITASAAFAAVGTVAVAGQTNAGKLDVVT